MMQMYVLGGRKGSAPSKIYNSRYVEEIDLAGFTVNDVYLTNWANVSGRWVHLRKRIGARQKWLQACLRPSLGPASVLWHTVWVCLMANCGVMRIQMHFPAMFYRGIFCLPSRAGHSAALWKEAAASGSNQSRQKRVVVFGGAGYDGTASSDTYLNDVHILDLDQKAWATYFVNGACSS